MAREHTQGADRSAWVTSGSLPSLERPVDLSPLLKRPADLSPSFERPLDLCLQSKITDLILSLQVPWGYMNILFAHVFFCLWLVIWTYILPFFSGNLLILSANGNICHSIHRQWIIFSPSSFIFLFPVKTTLLMLSCDIIASAKFIHDTLSILHYISPYLLAIG